MLIPQLRATLEPHGSDAALALVSTLVTDRPRIPSSYPADRQPPQIAINDKALMGVEGLTTLGSVQVRSLEVDDRTTPAGAWEIDFGWVVLGPGATLPPAADGEWSIATVISGSALPVPQNQIDPDTLEIRTNTEDRPALALLIELRRTPG